MPLAILPFVEAVEKYTSVAVVVSQFIRHLDKQLNIKPHRISIAGHSLGAHIAGKIGAIVKRTLKSSIGSIFGERHENKL